MLSLNSFSISSLLHEPSAHVANGNHQLMLEQADQETGSPFGALRYLHGHRRKEGLKRLTSYHLREMQCLRGRCMCPTLHSWDGNVHCKEYYAETPTNATHRHNRKNHNTFADLDDELNDEFDEDGSVVSWQTIFLMALGSSLLAGFIFR